MTTPPITNQPPDLVALVEEYGAAEQRVGACLDCEPDPRHAAARDAAKAALLAALSRAPAPTGERVPSQGWIMRANGRWYLTAGDHEARASLVDPAGDPRNLDAGPARWDVSIPAPGQRWIRNSDDSVDPGDPIAPVPPATLRLAMLAAEDALIAVRDEITAAVGR